MPETTDVKPIAVQPTNIQKSFEQFSKYYDMGTIDDFTKSISTPDGIKNAYDKASKHYDVGSIDEFTKYLSVPTSVPATTPTTAITEPVASDNVSGGVPSEYVPLIKAAAKKYNLPESTFTELLRQESGFNPDVVSGKTSSKKGAKGIGQFMDSTAKELGIDPLIPEQAIDGSARYLKQHLDTFNGDTSLALAAYNAGAGRVRDAGNMIPDIAETKNYVNAIMQKSSAWGSGVLGDDGSVTTQNDLPRGGQSDLHTPVNDGYQSQAKQELEARRLFGDNIAPLASMQTSVASAGSTGVAQQASVSIVDQQAQDKLEQSKRLEELANEYEKVHPGIGKIIQQYGAPSKIVKKENGKYNLIFQQGIGSEKVPFELQGVDVNATPLPENPALDETMQNATALKKRIDENKALNDHVKLIDDFNKQYPNYNTDVQRYNAMKNDYASQLDELQKAGKTSEYDSVLDDMKKTLQEKFPNLEKAITDNRNISRNELMPDVASGIGDVNAYNGHVKKIEEEKGNVPPELMSKITEARSDREQNAAWDVLALQPRTLNSDDPTVELKRKNLEKFVEFSDASISGLLAPAKSVGDAEMKAGRAIVDAVKSHGWVDDPQFRRNISDAALSTLSAYFGSLPIVAGVNAVAGASMPIAQEIGNEVGGEEGKKVAQTLVEYGSILPFGLKGILYIGASEAGKAGVDHILKTSDWAKDISKEDKARLVEAAGHVGFGVAMGVEASGEFMAKKFSPEIAKAKTVLRNTLTRESLEKTYSPEEVRNMYLRVNRGEAAPEETELVTKINDTFASPGEAVRKGVDVVKSGYHPSTPKWLMDILGDVPTTSQMRVGGKTKGVVLPSEEKTNANILQLQDGVQTGGDNNGEMQQGEKSEEINSQRRPQQGINNIDINSPVIKSSDQGGILKPSERAEFLYDGLVESLKKETGPQTLSATMVIDRLPELQRASTVQERKSNLKTAVALIKKLHDEGVAKDDVFDPKQEQEKVSSTQVNIPKADAKQFVDYGNAIPDGEIYDDEKKDYGRDKEPHVTALFGLKDNDPKAVEKVVKDFGNVQLEFGKTSLFKNKDYDVLKVDVKSDDMKKLNELLSKNLDYKSDFPDYHPHLTIAYLKPGEGEKYVGDNRFENMKVTVSQLLHSDPEYKKTAIELTPSVTKDEAVTSSPKEGKSNENEKYVPFKRPEFTFNDLNVESTEPVSARVADTEQQQERLTGYRSAIDTKITGYKDSLKDQPKNSVLRKSVEDKIAKLEEEKAIAEGDYNAALNDHLNNSRQHVLDEAVKRGIVFHDEHDEQSFVSDYMDEISGERPFIETNAKIPVKKLFNEVVDRWKEKQDELGENDFVKNGDSTSFGMIDKDVAKAIDGVAGEIRLRHGNDSFGEVHINRPERLKQLKKNGYADAKDIVKDVALHYDKIFKSKKNNNLILVKENPEKDSITFVELHQIEGEHYYDVQSAFVARKDYTNKKELLWDKAQSYQDVSTPQRMLGQSNSTTNIQKGVGDVKSVLEVSDDVLDTNWVKRRETGEYSKDGNSFARSGLLTDATSDKVVLGKNTGVVFAKGVTAPAQFAVVDASLLQPSHVNGAPNKYHFIPEAQPKNRSQSESNKNQNQEMAETLDPEQVIMGKTAFVGAPTVNEHGEVIQGNGRAGGEITYWKQFGDDPKGLRSAIKEYASVLGVDEKAIDAIKNPVVVRVLTGLNDKQQVKLGQYSVGDLESVANKTTQATAASRQLTNEDVQAISDMLQKSDTGEFDKPIGEVIQSVGLPIVDKLIESGAINADKRETFFTRDGRISPDGVDQIKNTLVNLLFRGGDTNVPELFRRTPASFQNAIERTVHYLLASPQRIDSELQNSILIHDGFVKSGLGSVVDFIRQPGLTDAAPIDKYGPEAATLAMMMMSDEQRAQVAKLKRFFLNAKGTEGDMFTDAQEPMTKRDSFASAFDKLYEEAKRYAIPSDGNKYFGNNDVDLSVFEKTIPFVLRTSSPLQGKNDGQIDLGFDAPETKEVTTTDNEKIKFQSIAGELRYKRSAGNRLATASAARSLKEGEQQFIIRLYRKAPFKFFGASEVIRGPRDVAILFRQLETESIEHLFIVHENAAGKNCIQHISTGIFDSSLMNMMAVADFANRFGTTVITSVHNHPSGNLQASKSDLQLLKVIKDAFPNIVVNDGMIIDLTEGKYSTYSTFDDLATTGKVGSEKGKIPFKVLSFSKQKFLDNVQLGESIRGPQDIAEFVSASRFSSGKKTQIISLNSANQIVGRFTLSMPITDTLTYDERERFMDEMVGLVTRSGGMSAILAGNTPVLNDEMKSLSLQLQKGLSKKGVTLHDLIGVEKSGFVSSVGQDRIVAEPKAEYGGTPTEFNQKAYEGLYKLSGFYVEKGVKDVFTLARLMALKVGNNLVKYPVEFQKAIKDGFEFFAEVVPEFTSPVTSGDVTPHSKEEIDPAHINARVKDFLDAAIKDNLRKEQNEHGIISEYIRGLRKDAVGSGNTDAGTNGGASSSGRPGLRVVDEKDLPKPREIVATDRYAIDESQRLAVNLALERFLGRISTTHDEAQIIRSAQNDTAHKGKKAFLLADGTGVGKTRTEIVVAYEMAKRLKKPALITTYDDVVIEGFRREAQALGIDLEASNIEIGTYYNLAAGKKSGAKGGAQYSKRDYAVHILDESHRIKNVESTRAAMATQVHADHVLYATATPMDKPVHAAYFMAELLERTPEDVAKELGFEIIKTPDANGNIETSVIPLKNLSWENVLDNMLTMRNEAIASGAMIRREYPFYGSIGKKLVAFTKEQEAEMQQIENYWNRYASVARGRIKRLMDSLNQRRDDGDMPLWKYFKELQIIRSSKNFKENPLKYSLMEAEFGLLREMSYWTEMQKLNETYNDVLQALEEGKRAIVYAQSVNPGTLDSLGQDPKKEKTIVYGGFLNTLGEMLQKKGIDFAKIYGSDSDKITEADRFQRGTFKVALATMESGGVGINLDDTTGDAPRKVLVVTANYAGDATDQMLGRVSRRNTKSPSEAVFMFNPQSASDRRRSAIQMRKLTTLRKIQSGEDPDRVKFEMPSDITPSNSPLKGENANAGLRIEPYQDSFVVVKGNTIPYRARLKEVGGGGYNKTLGGWLFPLSKERALKKEFAEELSVYNKQLPDDNAVHEVSSWYQKDLFAENNPQDLFEAEEEAFTTPSNSPLAGGEKSLSMTINKDSEKQEDLFDVENDEDGIITSDKVTPSDFNLEGKNVEPIDSDVEKFEGNDIEDFGEEIGDARKHKAVKRGSVRKVVDARPAWMKKYVILENPKTKMWGIAILLGKHGQIKSIGGDTFTTKDEAEKVFPLVEVSMKHRVYADRPDAEGKQKFAIFRKIGDRKLVAVKSNFASSEEATKYMALHAEEIINFKFPFPERPYLENIERIGPKRLDGNVSPKMFQDVFGFRGGQFGNWVTNYEGQQSLNHAFEALLDLADVLNIPPKAISLNGNLGIAFGARGNGGKESVAAHYERDWSVINLTKIRGAGSLAHEWMHGFDHYLGRLDGKASSITDAEGKLKASADPARDYASAGWSYDSKTRKELQDAFTTLVKAFQYKEVDREVKAEHEEKNVARAVENLNYYLDGLTKTFTTAHESKYKRKEKKPTDEQVVTWNGLIEKLRSGDVGELKTVNTLGNVRFGNWRSSYEPLEELNTLYKTVIGRMFFAGGSDSTGNRIYWAINKLNDAKKRLADANAGKSEKKQVVTDYYQNARDLDKMRSSSYWATAHELTARAFEAFVTDKLIDLKRRSDYLIFGADNKYYVDPLFGDQKPYPEGEDRTKLNGLFQKFVDVLQTNETDKGVAIGEPVVKYGDGEKLKGKSEKWYYSQMERVLGQQLPNSGTPEQMLATIEAFVKNGKFKKEEFEWSGLGEYLKALEGKSENGKVTKQDILDYIRENNVEVKEVVKGRKPASVNPLTTDEYVKFNSLIKKYDNLGFDFVGEAKGAIIEHADWAKRWDVEDVKELVELGNRFRDEKLTDRDDSKFSSYQLAGGENYRELLLTLPPQMKVPIYEVFKSSHFDELNILAHVRFNDRIIPSEKAEQFDKDYQAWVDGGKKGTSPNPNDYGKDKKMLFIEEIQSDWHQKGRKKGYREINKKAKVEYNNETKRYDVIDINGDKYTDAKDIEEANHIIANNPIVNEGFRGAVPDAPFKNSWQEVAFRRMVRYAAENGYDGIGWTTGEQQAERYDLSKQISAIQYIKVSDANEIITYDFTAYGLQGKKAAQQKDLTANQLSDYVGKEISEKIVNSKKDIGTIEGLDLKVGGEGMKGIYDLILPSYANKFGKKFGASAEEISIGKENLGEKIPDGAGGLVRTGDKTKPVVVHYLPVTEAMKESVLNEGVQLFEPRVQYGSLAGRYEQEYLQNKLKNGDSDFVNSVEQRERRLKAEKEREALQGSLRDLTERKKQLKRELEYKRDVLASAELRNVEKKIEGINEQLGNYNDDLFANENDLQQALFEPTMSYGGDPSKPQSGKGENALSPEVIEAEQRIDASGVDRKELFSKDGTPLYDEPLKYISRPSVILGRYSKTLERAHDMVVASESFMEEAVVNESKRMMKEILDGIANSIPDKNERKGWEALDFIWKNHQKKELEEFLKISVPLAGHLNAVSGEAGAWNFAQFEMRSGSLSRKDFTEMKNHNPELGVGSEIEVVNMLLTQVAALKAADAQELKGKERKVFISDFIMNTPIMDKRIIGEELTDKTGKPGYQLKRTVTKELQEELYKVYEEKYPSFIHLLDNFIDPALAKNTRTIDGVKIPVFNRYALAELMKVNDEKFEDVTGYTPDVYVNRSLLGMIKDLSKAIFAGQKSPGRKYKTGQARELGNVQDILKGFQIRAFQALREQTRQEFVRQAMATSIPVPPHGLVPEGWVKIQDGVDAVIKAIEAARNMRLKPFTREMRPDERKKYARMVTLPEWITDINLEKNTITIQPAHEIKKRLTPSAQFMKDYDFIEFIGEARLAAGKDYMLPKRVMDILVRQYSSYKVQSNILRTINYLAQESALSLLVFPGTFVINYTTNKMFTMEKLGRTTLSLITKAIMKGIGKKTDPVNDFRMLQNIAAQSAKGMFLGLQKRAGTDFAKHVDEIIPPTLFEHSTVLSDVVTGNFESAKQMLRRGNISGAMLTAFGYGHIDVRSKQRYALSYLITKGEKKATEFSQTEFGNKMTAKEKKQFVADFLKNITLTDRVEAVKAAEFEYLNYRDVPIEMQKFQKKGWSRLFIPFLRFGYAYTIKNKDKMWDNGIKQMFKGKTDDEKADGFANALWTSMIDLGILGIIYGLLSFNDDEDARKVIGTSVSKEVNEDGSLRNKVLPSELSTENRINISKNAPEWFKGWMRNSGMVSDNEDGWLRLRNYPMLFMPMLGILAGNDARKYGIGEGMATYFNGLIDLGQDFFNFGFAIKTAGKTVQSVSGARENPIDKYGSNIPFITYTIMNAMDSFVPFGRQADEVVLFIDPVRRRTADSKLLNYNTEGFEQLKNGLVIGHIPGIVHRLITGGNDLPSMGKVQNVSLMRNENETADMREKRMQAESLLGTPQANEYTALRKLNDGTTKSTNRVGFVKPSEGKYNAAQNILRIFGGLNVKGVDKENYEEAIGNEK